MLRWLDTWMHRLSWVVPYALGRWICDRYEAWLAAPVEPESLTWRPNITTTAGAPVTYLPVRTESAAAAPNTGFWRPDWSGGTP